MFDCVKLICIYVLRYLNAHCVGEVKLHIETTKLKGQALSYHKNAIVPHHFIGALHFLKEALLVPRIPGTEMGDRAFSFQPPFL